MKIKANLVDVVNNCITPAILTIADGKIIDIEKINETLDSYILPPFVDSHIHIESTMLVPSEFARIASTHGTVAVVADPHEIANVLGIEGVRFFLQNANPYAEKKIKFFFGVPSCVPATDFETSGARITPSDVEKLFDEDHLTHLGEMMNFPGVIYDVPEVIEKIKIARERGKVIDGHCPRLTGDDLKKYINAGISTDHECTSIDEAFEKINLGMKIQIRSGSSAKDFDNLFSLIDQFPDSVMFASDDLHASDLLNGHLNVLIKQAIARGANLMNVLKAASLNPINHYGLNVGKLQIGDDADFVIVDNLTDFNVLQTYCCGKIIAEKGTTSLPQTSIKPINNFKAELGKITPKSIAVTIENTNTSANTATANIIDVKNGFITTMRSKETLEVINSLAPTSTSGPKNRTDVDVRASVEKDILKLVVLNRYEENAKPAVAFVRGFGITNGAIATSVAHDSHNIIAVGSDDESICKAIHIVIREKGGMAVFSNSDKECTTHVLPLPIAGLMSNKDAGWVAQENLKLEAAAKANGTKLDAPFVTLSFLALLVIPELKLSDKGLFNAVEFRFEEVIDGM